MIRLHYSNRLENLIAPLAGAVAAHQRREPLVPVSIVVPNRVVEQFIRYRLAESIGVAANLKFPFLRNYLAELLQSTDKNLKILDADELQLILFECLRSSSHRDDPDLKPARDYIQAGSRTDADVELRTILLAAQLARLFREYSISRRRMIEKWRAARRPDVDAMGETERWQRHLWQLVFDSHGRVREQWLLERETRLMMLPGCIRGGRQPPPQVCPAGDASRVRRLVRGKCLCGNFRATRRTRGYSDLRAQSVPRVLGRRGYFAPRRAHRMGSSSRQSRRKTR